MYSAVCSEMVAAGVSVSGSEAGRTSVELVYPVDPVPGCQGPINNPPINTHLSQLTTNKTTPSLIQTPNLITVSYNE